MNNQTPPPTCSRCGYAHQPNFTCENWMPTGPGVIDSNVEAVRRKMSIRAELGLRKYGVTTERTDLNRIQWLQHAQDEAMDLAVYLQVLITEERNKKAQLSDIIPEILNEPLKAGCAPGDETLGYLAGEISRLRTRKIE